MLSGSTPMSDCQPLPRSGTGVAFAHHGELLQGVFEDERGRLHRGLVTLPISSMSSRATFAQNGSSTVTVEPGHKAKAALAARLTLDRFGADGSGNVRIESDIPVGHGYGSSTADVVATIRAVGAAFSRPMSPSLVSEIAVAAEKASDAIAYDGHAVLFAQREGTIIEDFGNALPPLLVVGLKAGSGAPIDTLKLPRARYDQTEIQQFRVLRGLIAHGVSRQDPICIGRAATASAWISQKYLLKEAFGQVLSIAESFGACGVQVAHSGSLIGVLFDPAEKRVRHRIRRVVAALGTFGCRDIEVLHVNCDGLP